MATSMFDPSGRFISTDPKAAEAFLKGTGGQTLPSSPAAQRAWELSQQRAMQMQQGMAEGQQAVAGLKAQQALTPPTISGLPSSQVVTSDNGFKAVLDAKGNIVGTSAPTAPVSASVGQFADERAAFNQGRGTMLEKAALGPNIRDAFLKEYAKPKPVQAVAVPSFIDKLGQPTFGGQTLPDDTPDNASRVARQIFGGSSTAAPPAAATADTSAQQARLGQDIGLMEAQFGAQGAAPNRDQNPQGNTRAELYRELQKLTGQLKNGITSVPGQLRPDYSYSEETTAPASLEQLADTAKRVSEVQAAIKGSQETVQPTDEASIAKWLGMTKQLEDLKRPAAPPAPPAAAPPAAAGFSKGFEEQAALDADIRQMEAKFKQQPPSVQDTVTLESKKKLLAEMQKGTGAVLPQATAPSAKGDPTRLKKLKEEQAALEKKARDMRSKIKEKEAELNATLKYLSTPEKPASKKPIYQA